MTSFRRGIGRSCAGFVALAPLTLAVCFAQSATHLADPQQAPASRWAVESAAVDEQIRQKSLAVNTPRAHWVAGHFDTTDIASQVTHYTAARVAVPQEKVYLASLAVACLQPVSPALPECDAVDRLADWATRDTDNGVPLLLLATRAGKRGNNDAVVAYLEQAAGTPRFDDYASRGGLEFWEYVMTFPIDAERAAKAETAAGYAKLQPAYAVTALLSVCGATPAPPEARRAACAGAGKAMADRGATLTVRSVGAGVAERNASDPAAAERARAKGVVVQVLASRCGAEAQTLLEGAESADPAVRARALEAWDARTRQIASLGEAAACEKRVGS